MQHYHQSPRPVWAGFGGGNQFAVQHKPKSMFGGLDSVNVQTNRDLIGSSPAMRDQSALIFLEIPQK
jgi:hypothetical protein